MTSCQLESQLTGVYGVPCLTGVYKAPVQTGHTAGPSQRPTLPLGGPGRPLWSLWP
eukprot:NODE_7333_length_574_cov_5.910476_g6321_i0.p3 GENE.NODE_7333_length_574_cov_5.910476_g6321_i0~~NODE_7333_length_574_cov_5.910476_g6321_i0.p3  ORF type:complete len:56 (-),score=4.63 NODE_7333_length_574_cov_5.910476_g6321_i0:93-260(-)